MVRAAGAPCWLTRRPAWADSQELGRATAKPTWTWNSSLMRSKGAVHVRAIAPAIPPAKNILFYVARGRHRKFVRTPLRRS